MDFRGVVWKRVCKITFFRLKSGQDLKNRAAHPHQEFPGVPPQPPRPFPPGGHIPSRPQGCPLRRGSNVRNVLYKMTTAKSCCFIQDKDIYKKTAKRKATWGFPIFWTDKPSFFNAFFIKCLKTPEEVMACPSEISGNLKSLFSVLF